MAVPEQKDRTTRSPTVTISFVGFDGKSGTRLMTP